MRAGADTLRGGTETCGLAAAAGRREACPGASCPLWEAEPNAPAAGYAIGRMVPHLKTRPELVHYLLELRQELGELAAEPLL
jgi:hypothetical protein